MSKDDLEKAIREAMNSPTVIDGSDLEPPVCAQCGETLSPSEQIVVWDIPEHESEHIIHRYRYCSHNCKSEAQNAAMSNIEGEEPNPYGESEVLTPEGREVLE